MAGLVSKPVSARNSDGLLLEHVVRQTPPLRPSSQEQFQQTETDDRKVCALVGGFIVSRSMAT